MPLSHDQSAEIESARAEHSATLRPTVPALEAMLFQAIPVLDHGFIRVIDYMGDDCGDRAGGPRLLWAGHEARAARTKA